MTNAGNIQRKFVVNRPEELGLSITVITQIEVRKDKVESLTSIESNLVECPFVQQCYYVSGEWDFILVILAKNLEHYTSLTRELFFEKNNIKRFHTLVAIKTVKYSHLTPVLESLDCR